MGGVLLSCCRFLFSRLSASFLTAVSSVQVKKNGVGILNFALNLTCGNLPWPCQGCLVPRPHPLTRKGGLVTIEQFLGCAESANAISHVT